MTSSSISTYRRHHKTGTRPSRDCLDDRFADPTNDRKMTNEQWLAVRKLPCRLIQKLRRCFGHYECRRQPSARSCTRGAFARRQSPAGANRHEETDQMSKESTVALWDAK
jgi:hypothetical protein